MIIWPIEGAGGSSSGIASINGDTTSAQTIVGVGIGVSTVGGTTTLTNLAPLFQSDTWANWDAARTANTLPKGSWIEIVDATDATIPLCVFCSEVNEIGPVAFDPAFPKDFILYNMDETNPGDNGRIMFRRDPDADISSYSDWRNSVTPVSIGTGCVHVNFGVGANGSVGNNCLYIDVGVEAHIECFNGCSNITIETQGSFIDDAAGVSARVYVKERGSVHVALAAADSVIGRDSQVLAYIVNKINVPDGVSFADGSFTQSISGLDQNRNCLVDPNVPLWEQNQWVWPGFEYYFSPTTSGVFATLGIYIKGGSVMKFSSEGRGGFYVPDHHFKGNYSGVIPLTGFGTDHGPWNSGLTTAIGDYAIDNIDGQYYVNFSGSNGATDPSTDPSNWRTTFVSVWSDANEGSYENNYVVAFNGKHYAVKDATAVNGTDPATNGTAYLELPFPTSNLTPNSRGYIEEWQRVVFDPSTNFLCFREDKRQNAIWNGTVNAIQKFQWGCDAVRGNTVQNEGLLECVNAFTSTAAIANNLVATQVSVSMDHTHLGGCQGNKFLSAQGSITCNMGSAKNFTGNTVDVNIGFTVDPTIDHINKEITNALSTFECTIDISGLTDLDVLAANNYCGIVNVTSSNANEAIDTITNTPTQFPVTLYPEDGLTLDVNSVDISIAMADEICLEENTGVTLVGRTTRAASDHLIIRTEGNINRQLGGSIL